MRDRLNIWLASESFRPIREKLLEQLIPSDEVRIILQAESLELQRLPWHLWDFCDRYPKAEFALSATVYEQVEQLSIPTNKVRILAILGHSAGIDIQEDKIVLEQLPDAEICFLVEPECEQLSENLWKQNWDILFFAGHSSSGGNQETGLIYINPTDSLTIEQLKYALRNAVKRGLKIAIFNSCDGLGLARDLASLQIPQIILMREPVPDRVAQQFLKCFLEAFSRGDSFYLAVREARERLQGLEAKFPCATWLPLICQNPAVLPPIWQDLYRENEIISPTPPPMDINDSVNHRSNWWRGSFCRVFLVSLAISILIIALRYFGIFQSQELQAFDNFMQLQPIEAPDRRLLVVTIDEADIQYQNQMKMPIRWSLSDRGLEQLLKKLDRYQPRTIGIDIYRDFAVDANYTDLVTRLQTDNRIFAPCKVAAPDDGDPNGIPPPPEVPSQRLSFSDFVADEDDILRRHLLHLTPPLNSDCAAKYAFSLKLALHYLGVQDIKSDVTSSGNLRIGNVEFKRLKSHTSGYQGVDARGYQMLLNYRSFSSAQAIVEGVPLRDILSDGINPELAESLKDRIVIIGVTASSSADYWETPYSSRLPSNQKQIPGVFVQAQMVSQIISAVLDGRRLFWWWDWWVEVLWIWGWSLVGGIIGCKVRKPVHIGLAGVMALGVLWVICFTIFTQAGWIPLIPSVLALIIAQVVSLKVRPLRQ